MMTWLLKLVDGLALIYLIYAFPIPVFWLIIHPAIKFWRRFGSRSFWVAAPVWVASGIIFVWFRKVLYADRFHRDALTWILGVILIILAVWIDRQVHHDFGLRRIVGLPEMNPAQYPGRVVHSGVYAYLRHPRYLECMLALVGFGLLTGARDYLLLAVTNIILYQIVAPFEERELHEHYGSQYELYAKAVPRFLPRFWRKTKPQTSS